jgi:hypothetical protein
MGENTMKRIKSFIAVGAFALAVMALPAVASAQYRGQDNGYWSGNMASNIRGTALSLQSKARNFDRLVGQLDNRRDDRQRDRYGRDRNDRVDNLDRLATQFKNAAENLADEVGRGRNISNSRDEAQRVLSLGSQIDRELSQGGGRGVLSRNNSRGNLMSDWNQIERDLQTVARAYGLNYRNTNGGIFSRLPF